MSKVFVKITAEHDVTGITMPTIIHWADGNLTLTKFMTCAKPRP
jgi:hypothetical protein